jgi:hypothetical protein
MTGLPMADFSRLPDDRLFGWRHMWQNALTRILSLAARRLPSYIGCGTSAGSSLFCARLRVSASRLK